MKRITFLFLFALISIAFGSCSKKGDPTTEPPDYYFRFKANSVPVDYPFLEGNEYNLIGNVNMAGNDPVNGVYHVTNIAGMRTIEEGGALNNYRNSVSVFMQQPGRFETDVTYSNMSDGSAQIINQVFLLAYYNSDGELYSASTIGAPGTLGEGYLRFEKMGDTYIKGKFWGTLVATQINGSSVTVISEIQITDGEFMVPRF